MTDDRDICERLEDPNYDGAVFLRINAAKEIRALRHYVARLEDELAEEEYQHGRTIIKLENAREHISDQALDIVTLGQEVGRLREALRDALSEYDRSTCLHEETHRGGVQWTICNSCGVKWGDDEGGFKPYADPPRIAAARAALAQQEKTSG